MNVCKTTILAAIFLSQSFIFAFYASAAGKCRPNTPYYFSEFNQSSWKIDDELNYEEVYKNLEFFEVIFNKSCDEITVRKRIKGEVISSERYRLNADGSLSKINAD